MEGQAKDDPKQGPPAVPSGNGGGRCHWAGAEGTLPSARGGACLCSILRARRMGPCSSAGVGRSSAHLSPECRHAGVAPQGRTSPGRGRTPAGQQPLNTVLRGHRASAAVHSLEEDRELLNILNQQGPVTERIFWRAASRTALQELKEALDSGADIELGSQPVLLLAIIPAKLLVIDLYEDWMRAMEKPSKQEPGSKAVLPS
ncbi:uncharacterized protein M6G45_015703 [Spheniscus humboldti]